MLQRIQIIKYVVPIIALGVLIFSSSAYATEAGTQLALAPRSSPSRNGTVSKATPASVKAKPPVSVESIDAQRHEIAAADAWGQINGTAVNVRSAPNTQGAVVTTLKGGDFVHARATQNGWLEIDLPRNSTSSTAASSTNKTVYVSAKYVLLGVQAPATSAVPTTSTVPVASTARTASAAKPTTVTTKISAPEKATPVAPARVEVAALAALNKTAKNATPTTEVSNNTAPVPTTTTAIAAKPVVSLPTVLPVVSTSTVVDLPKVKVLPTARPVVVPPVAVESAHAIPAEPSVVKEDLIATIQDTRRRIEEASTGSRYVAPVSAPILAPVPASPLIPDEEIRTSQGTVSLTHEIEALRFESDLKKLRAERIELEETQRKLTDEARKLEEVAKSNLKIASLPSPSSLVSLSDAPNNLPKKIEIQHPEVQPETAGVFEVPSMPEIATSVSSQAVLLEPQRSSVSDRKMQPTEVAALENHSVKGIVFQDDPTEIIPSLGEEAKLDPTPEAVKNARSKFVVPAKEPRKTGVSSESIDVSHLNPLPSAATETNSIIPPIQQPVQQPRKATPTAVESIDLPRPASEAPSAFRLPSQSGTLVRSVNEASGRVCNDEGILERVEWSPLNGVNFALMQNGRVLHYVTGRDQMDLSPFVGQKVLVSGTPLNSVCAGYSAVEVVSITARD